MSCFAFFSEQVFILPSCWTNSLLRMEFSWEILSLRMLEELCHHLLVGRSDTILISFRPFAPLCLTWFFLIRNFKHFSSSLESWYFNVICLSVGPFKWTVLGFSKQFEYADSGLFLHSGKFSWTISLMISSIFFSSLSETSVNLISDMALFSGFLSFSFLFAFLFCFWAGLLKCIF